MKVQNILHCQSAKEQEVQKLINFNYLVGYLNDNFKNWKFITSKSDNIFIQGIQNNCRLEKDYIIINNILSKITGYPYKYLVNGQGTKNLREIKILDCKFYNSTYESLINDFK